MIEKTFLHFRAGFEPGFAGSDFGRRDGGQQSASANGVHHAMMEMLLGLEEVRVVGGHERDAEFAADALGFAQRTAIAGREMLDFDVEAITENVFEV